MGLAGSFTTEWFLMKTNHVDRSRILVSFLNKKRTQKIRLDRSYSINWFTRVRNRLTELEIDLRVKEQSLFRSGMFHSTENEIENPQSDILALYSAEKKRCLNDVEKKETVVDRCLKLRNGCRPMMKRRNGCRLMTAVKERLSTEYSGLGPA